MDDGAGLIPDRLAPNLFPSPTVQYRYLFITDEETEGQKDEIACREPQG